MTRTFTRQNENVLRVVSSVNFYFHIEKSVDYQVITSRPSQLWTTVTANSQNSLLCWRILHRNRIKFGYDCHPRTMSRSLLLLTSISPRRNLSVLLFRFEWCLQNHDDITTARLIFSWCGLKLTGTELEYERTTKSLPMMQQQQHDGDRIFKYYSNNAASATVTSGYMPSQCGYLPNKTDNGHNASNDMHMALQASASGGGYLSQNAMTAPTYHGHMSSHPPTTRCSPVDVKPAVHHSSSNSNSPINMSSPNSSNSSNPTDSGNMAKTLANNDNLYSNSNMSIPLKKRPLSVPENQKDISYWDKRKKNNDSAKRSREARRTKEEQIAMRVVYLEQENLQLRTEVSLLRSEIEKLRCMLYNAWLQTSLIES